MRQCSEACNYLVQRGQHHRVACLLQHQRVTQVVDVFRSAGKVDELSDLHHFRILGEAFLEKILNGFNIVIGGGFNGFDALTVGLREIHYQRVKRLNGGRCKSGHFGNGGFSRQRLQPGKLNLHAKAHQRPFAKQRTQGRDLGLIAPVER